MRDGRSDPGQGEGRRTLGELEGGALHAALDDDRRDGAQAPLEQLPHRERQRRHCEHEKHRVHYSN